jgi:hypothetical protein
MHWMTEVEYFDKNATKIDKSDYLCHKIIMLSRRFEGYREYIWLGKMINVAGRR